MMLSQLSLLLLGASSVLALPDVLSPILSPVLQPVQCKITDPVIVLLNQEAGAAAFCTSVLKIKTITSYKTAIVTPRVVTSIRGLTTTGAAKSSTKLTFATLRKTNVVTVTATAKTTVTTDVTSTTTIGCFTAGTTLAAPTLSKRDAEERDLVLPLPTLSIPVPALLAPIASPLLSSGCSCLSLATPTSTITIFNTLIAKTSTVISISTYTPTNTLSVTNTFTSVTVAVATVTLTQTSTSTRTSIATAAATNGLSYYAFSSPYYFPSGGSRPNVDLFHSNNYVLTGQGGSLSGAVTNAQYSCTMPDGKVLTGCDKSSIVFQAFFYAAKAGTYVFTVPSTNDNFMTIYTGANALGAAWSNTNYDLLQENSLTVAKAYNFAAGQLVPLTVFWNNYGGYGTVKLLITTPDGVVHDTDKSSFFAPICAAGNPFTP